MIIYNIRANGPWEYDKFILNSTQLYNNVQALKESDLLDTIKLKIKEYDDRLKEITSDNTSATNKFILQDLKERGMIVGH